MNNIVIIDAKWFGYCCIIHGYGISQLINLSKKSVLGYKDSVKNGLWRNWYYRVYSYQDDSVIVEDLKFRNVIISCKS